MSQCPPAHRRVGCLLTPQDPCMGLGPTARLPPAQYSTSFPFLLLSRCSHASQTDGHLQQCCAQDALSLGIQCLTGTVPQLQALLYHFSSRWCKPAAMTVSIAWGFLSYPIPPFIFPVLFLTPFLLSFPFPSHFHLSFLFPFPFFFPFPIFPFPPFLFSFPLTPLS